ncbi:hypothetical protein M2137_002565 [Parabacteroides sp. PFB2-10]|uniref:hypothetical protein n=1 Tax=Parabacteroides sp. PFB2-10 TaxID=1742405 RepID=UPI002473F81B|nr:hypothetical protein [Parabacteroides sp. PFB2-10]MDH6313775.1 hypothetical protein [Parabacteroides sp. PFB2-10]MDL2245000.1 hypothetical protein [Parabacteroides sp. OttesenSCG-928-J18]
MEKFILLYATVFLLVMGGCSCSGQNEFPSTKSTWGKTASDHEHQWGGKVLDVGKMTPVHGVKENRFHMLVVKMEVTHSATIYIDPGEIVYAELEAFPLIIPEVGREYVFTSSVATPVYTLYTYMLNTKVLDIVADIDY